MSRLRQLRDGSQRKACKAGVEILNPDRFTRFFGMAAVLVSTAFFAAACVQAAPRNEPTPTPEPTATPVAEPTAEPTPDPTATPVAPTPTAPVPTATPAGSATPGQVSNSQTYTLSLEIEGISDESIVYGNSIVLKGQTTADAVVSVNGVIVPVDEIGAFTAPLLLDPGPNQIDVVASDLDGNQVSASFLVVSLVEEQA